MRGLLNASYRWERSGLRGLDPKRCLELSPGVAYCVVIAALSYATWYLYKPVSSLMWAFIYSIVATNVIGLPRSCAEGANFSSSKLLKGTIGVLGLVTSVLIWLGQLTRIFDLTIALAVIAVSFALSLWVGSRMGLSRRLSMLIGVGTAICGASAIAAISPAIEAEEEEVGLAIAGITLFGLISMFLYPFLFLNTPINGLLLGNPNVYAVWVGSGVHETAQVLAAAGALGSEVTRPAMLIKSVRIFMIGPVVLLASYVFNRYEGRRGGSAKVALPAFGVVFMVNTVVCALLDTYAPGVALFGLTWPSLKSLLSKTVIPFLLAIAFAGVGSKVKFRKIARLGLKPFAVAAFMAVTAGTFALTLAILVAPLISRFT
ncbi:MAG: YeiH family protein [Candidatus Bathyarchaeia archaeon]